MKRLPESNALAKPRLGFQVAFCIEIVVIRLG